MWRVRLPYSTEDSHGYVKNMNHLVSFSVQPNPEPLPDDAVTPAFENRNYHKLVRLMGDDKLVVRRKALEAVVWQLQGKGSHIASFMDAGLVVALNKATTDGDVTVRERAVQSLYWVSLEKRGRFEMVRDASIKLLAKLFEDESTEARKLTQLTCYNLGLEAHIARPVIELGTVSALVKKCTAEEGLVQSLMLQTIHQYLKHEEGLQQALANGGVNAMAQLLKHNNHEVREWASMCVFGLSVPAEGKLMAIECGIVPMQVSLLTDSEEKVRAASAAALMSLTIDNGAKTAAISANICSELPPLLEDSNSSEVLVANVTKVVANLAEHPTGRQQLAGVVETLQKLCNSDVEMISKHANSAVRILTWVP